MKRNPLSRAAAGTAVALGLGLVLTAFAPLAFGDPPAGEPPVVQTLTPMADGLTWGMSHVEVTKVYNQIGGMFDREYDPILARTQPGVQMQALEADRENRKAAFAASYLEFRDTPTGYDATGVKDEYTYKNHESIMSVDKDGKRRFLFFMGNPPGDHLWKIYDEIPLKAGAPLGATYNDAVRKLASTLGAVPRITHPDPAKKIMLLTADWQDPSTHLRADDRSGDHVVGIVLEDKRTVANLPQLRANKVDDPFALDPSVSAITRGGISDPSAARAQADAGAPKKKKGR